MFLFVNITKALLQLLSERIDFINEKKLKASISRLYTNLNIEDDELSTLLSKRTIISPTSALYPLINSFNQSIDPQKSPNNQITLYADDLIKLSDGLKNESEARKIIELSKTIQGLLEQEFLINYSSGLSNSEVVQQSYENAYNCALIFNLVGDRTGLETFFVCGNIIRAMTNSDGKLYPMEYLHAWDLVLTSNNNTAAELNRIIHEFSNTLTPLPFKNAKGKILLVDIVKNRIISTNHPLAKLYLGNDGKPLYHLK